MSTIPIGRVGPSGKQLADHVLWFWSYRATLVGSLKECLERDGSSPASAGARTGNKSEHPGLVPPDIVLWG